MKRIRTSKTRRPFQAERDDHGVPHIRAKTWHDALYGLGYLHALDRGTQLFFSRSVASGRASAEISSSAELCETDRFFRRVALITGLESEVGVVGASRPRAAVCVLRRSQ